MLCHGFGYDPVINDYKVIRHTNVSIESSGEYSGDLYNIGPTWEIYSLRSDSWRELCVDMPYMLMIWIVLMAPKSTSMECVIGYVIKIKNIAPLDHVWCHFT